jgi:acyl-CoA synthetase (AMP-forming)/AMP-acid ligase II
MDIRSLTLLAIKLIGLFFFAEAVAQFAQNTQAIFIIGYDKFFEGVRSPFMLAISPIIYVIVGAILFRASGKITHCVIGAEGAEPSLLTVYRLLSVAIRIVCLYFMFKSLYSLVWHWTEAYLSAGGKNPMFSLIVSHKDKALLLAAGVQFVVALLGWFYAGKIADVTRKISKDE